MKRVLSLVLMLIMLSFPSAAHADIAPPAHPPGSNLQPGAATTQVRMVAETVLIEVLAATPEKSLGQAYVTADFTMRNLGQAPESMAARFPIGASDGWSSVNELRDLHVKVGGRPVATRRITGEDPYNGTSPVPWDEFDVTFPPGQDVAVQVKYTLEASGEYPYVWFKYVLSTGAGWKDSIGSADIIVRLPYEASAENLLLDTGDAWSGTTKGGELSGNSIRWHYEDLEPTTQDNFEINLVMPSAWEQFLTEQQNVAQNPQDGEAWGRLGKVCKEMAFSSRGKGFRAETGSLDPGAASLYQQSLDAYSKAVMLLPKDALWHAGYADLLTYHAYFDGYNGSDTREEAVHGLREIQTALDLAPQDPKVQEIAERIAWSFPDGMQRGEQGYVFTWLTTTPTFESPTLSPSTEVAGNNISSATAPAVSTSTSTAQPTVAPAPTPKPSAPFCGSAAALPVLLVALALVNGKRKTRKG